jgi:hypothetical protein
MAAAVSNGPPAEVESSELWRKLTQRPRPVSDPIDFPESDETGKPVGQYRLRILTETELQYVRATADIAARQIMGKSAPKNGEVSFGYEDIYRNELTVQMVAIACRDVNKPHALPAFMSAKHARDRLTTDQFGVIMNAYALFRRDHGPEVAELTVEEMEAWIKVLMEGGKRLPLARLTSEALTDLVMHLVSKLKSLSEDSGSAGSPPADSPMETPARDDAAPEPEAPTE